MPVTARIDRFQRRHHWAAFPIAVIYKYFDDFGPYVAAMIAYYAFVSLFPLLLLASTILGIVLSNDPDLSQRLINSGVRQIPVVGSQLSNPGQIGGGTGGFVIGVVVALYGGLGVAQAVQYMANTAWGVPRNSRPNPFKARGRSVVLLCVGGLATLATTYLSTLGTHDQLQGYGILVGSVIINSMAAIFAFQFSTTRTLSTHDVLIGAIAAAVGWQLLQSFGVIYVRAVISKANEVNGVFAVVLGLLAFLFLAGNVVVFATELNVVRVDHLYPRALLTPFTDRVHLTGGDRKAYTSQAKAQRLKGFQEIEVRFNHPPPEQFDRPPSEQ